jgi:hypothetical protein
MCNIRRQKCDKEISRDDSKIKRPYSRNTAHVECKNKYCTSKNSGSWNHIKIIQKIPEQYNGKARYQGTTENSHIGHCTRTAGSTDVKYRTLNMGNSFICSIYCFYRTAATLYTTGTWFVSGI